MLNKCAYTQNNTNTTNNNNEYNNKATYKFFC